MLFLQLAAPLVVGLALEVAASVIPHDAPAAPHSVKKRVVPATHMLHERGLPHWTNTWEKRAKVPADALLPMRIGLRQSNVDVGHDMLMERSDPASRSFGKHMSAEEVIDLFAPAEESVRVVIDWVVSSGIPRERVSQSANKQWIQFDAKASEAEDLLITDYFIFEHHATGTKNVAADAYHIPSHIKEHIDYITPGIRLRADPGKVRKHKRELEAARLKKRGVVPTYTGLVPISEKKLPGLPQLNSSVCNLYVTPECIRTQYTVPEGKTAAPGNELGIFESLNDHYSKDDLDGYFSKIYPKIPNGTYPIEKLIDGAVGAAQTNDEVGAESDLDFQAAWPLIWPQKTVLFQTDDQYYEINQTTLTTPYLGFWNTFFDALDGSYCHFSAFGETGNCKKPECLDPVYPDPNPGGYKGQLQCGVYKPTNVISISYGGGEADLPAYYSKRQCLEILKLGLQGVTVVISSGDDGVGSYEGDGGYPTGCAGKNGTVFYPATDATCPYVLAVGSTQFDSTGVAGAKLNEVATQRFPSGGGFSNVFETPLWQKHAVKTYFDTVKLNFTGYTNPGTNFSDVGTGVYHIGGRGYPDVSAVGDRYVIRYNSSWYTIGGTSLSAPVWAGLLTLVNEERIADGKGTLGFINPALYANPQVFNDVTSGSNPNCKSTGFLAAPGWDPVTGLG
ncbi:alkaline serine protease [Cercophora scortea]|uniref:tripeptidyl-peptidase II n=1 Tax=Cercophora scortea TaxID=314031 RepID=A0AAE0I7K8_9PEZI|nr:alkaline serine protease [Cercophora scortea]